MSPPIDATDQPYVIRRFESRDRDSFLSLYRSVWHVPRSQDWFEWRFVDNPFRRDVAMVVAECEGELIGAEPLLPFRLAVGGQVVNALQPVDWIVHPDHRRRGVFRRMTERLLEWYRDEADLLFNFPTSTILPGMKHYGWRDLGQVPHCFRIQRPSRLLAATVGNAAPPVIPAMATWIDPVVRGARALRDRLVEGDQTVRVERHRTIPVSDLIDLYESGPPTGIHVPRDAAYYRWRFQNPDWETTVHVANRDDAPVASAVALAGEIDDIRRVRLLDIQMAAHDEGAPRAIESVVRDVIAAYPRADILKTTATALPLVSRARLGFWRSDTFPLSSVSTDPTLAVRPLGDAESRAVGSQLANADLADWQLSLADQDIA